MSRLRPYPVAAFAALTLAIWGNRIWLAWTNDEDTVAEKLVWSTPITAFVIAAVVVLAMLLRGADRHVRPFRLTVTAFAAGTTLYWAIRLSMILAGDWSGPFKVVHSVLAVTSVAAALVAWRSLPRSPSAATASSAAVVEGRDGSDRPGRPPADRRRTTV